MADKPSFDTQRAHKYFSASCFNMTWELIEKPDRTREDDEQMIRMAQASLWHWTQRSDCSDKNVSIGYWQVRKQKNILPRPGAVQQQSQTQKTNRHLSMT